MGKNKKIKLIARILHQAHTCGTTSWDSLLDCRDWSDPYTVSKKEYSVMARKILPLIDEKELEKVEQYEKSKMHI